MKKLIFFTILLTSSRLMAQLPVFDNPNVPIIRKQVHIIDSLLEPNFETLQFEIDSINITGKVWTNKFETLSYFRNSDTKLKIDFYLQEDNLLFVKIEENSKKYKDLAASMTEFYYKDGEFLLTWDYYKRPTGLAMRPDENVNKFYGYNEAFDETFLRKYSDLLFRKIK